MASMPQPMNSPIDQLSIERTFEGFRWSLARMSIPQLLELAARQAALLQADRDRVLSETLLAYHQNQLDSPVLSTMPTSPDGSAAAGPADRPSPRSSPPSPVDRRSGPTSAGRRVARGLTRRAMAVSAKRARAEGRR